MDLESPDVEKHFPGLYVSDAVKISNESDFSDESHDKTFKKDLIIGKKKEKKDSKKDRGYAALESSGEENAESRSPCKSKKNKSFKFSTKKAEKREKSKDKDMDKKDKDKKEKEKEKEKIKSKEKKKVKPFDEGAEYAENFDIFGVTLETAVERCGCLDGVPIPLVIRNCIDCIHSFGLFTDNLYKVLGMKSKVQAFKKMYNARENVSLGECDVPVATCLLKTFLRELPEPLLTFDLLTRFEEAGAIMEVDSREKELQNLILQLPTQNKVLLGWLIVHFDTVTQHEKYNKLNAQSIAMTFSPVLQMSHRLLTAFLCHCKTLFSNIVIERYVPPLCPGSSFPDEPEKIALELKKQEFLLNQIHKEMSNGFVSKKKEEQLWEVQRIVTQLKRKLRSFQKFQESNTNSRSLEEDCKLNFEINEQKIQTNEKNDAQLAQIKHFSEVKNKDCRNDCSEINLPGTITSINNNEHGDSPVKSLSEKVSVSNESSFSMTNEMDIINLKSQLEYEELLKFKNLLKSRIEQEKSMITELKAKIQSFENKTSAPVSPEFNVNVENLVKDFYTLQNKLKELTIKIFEERMACIRLKVYVNILNMPEQKS